MKTAMPARTCHDRAMSQDRQADHRTTLLRKKLLGEE
jgi:hypothetical protein